MMKNYASYSFSRSVTRHEHFARRDLLSLQHRRGEPVDALAKQVIEAKEAVKRNHWLLVDSFVESRSGTTAEGRREYLRLFDQMQSDQFDVIVIKSQDRLMRNTKDWYVFIERMQKNGKQLYLYLENKFYSPEDALISGIKAIMAEEYSRELSKKINNAHRHRQKNGGRMMLTNKPTH